MKPIAATLFLLCSVLWAGVAGAMDSATLLSQPDRYRVIGTQADGIIYVDRQSLQGIQTMDYPNSLETLTGTLYVEKYTSSLDVMAFQENRLIRQINEYDATLHANKRDQTYTLTATLRNVYTPQGQPYEIKVDTVQFDQIQTLFINAHRISLLPQP